MATYNDLISNSQFVSDAAQVLTALGEDVPDNAQEVVDDLLTEQRWGGLGVSETPGNIFSALDHRNKLSKIDENTSAAVNRVATQLEQLPGIFEEGGSPVVQGIWDYVSSSITDPITATGMLVGAFAGPGGVVAGRTASTAASKSAASWLANNLRIATSKPVLKAVALESTITGAGAAYRSKVGQDINIGLGRQDETDYGTAFKAAVIEGPTAVVAGNALGLAIRGTVKAIDAGATAVAPNAVEAFKTQILPKSARDPFAAEIAERVQGQTNALEDQAQTLSRTFDKTLNKVYKTKEERLNANVLANKILQNSDDVSKDAINQIHPSLRPILFDTKELIKKAQRLATTPKDLTDGFRKTVDSNNDYSRFVYEVFRVNKRPVSFKKFVLKNPNILNELETEILANPTFFQKYSTIKGMDAILGNDADLKQRAVFDIAKKLYEPKRGAYKLRGSLESRVEIPKTVQRLWGKDYSAGQAITESVAGILRASETARFGTEIAESLLGRGLAIKTTDPIDAARKFDVELDDVVPLFGKDSILPINRDIFDPDMHYTTRATKAKLEPLVRFFDAERPLFANPMVETLAKKSAKVQGTLKIGKTVLAPVGILRNMFSASLAFAGTGNSVSTLRAIKELSPLLKNASNEDKIAFKESLSGLGLTGQSIDLQQSLTRLGRDINETPGFIEKIGTFGLASFSPNLYRKALNFYGGTDDFSKMLTYVGELAHQNRVFKSLSPEQRLAQKEILERGFGRTLSDAEYLSKKAAMNTKSLMPVYSRVPLVTESALTRSLPIIGNFSAYPSEIFRNAFNIFRVGTEEIIDGMALGNAPMLTRGLFRLHTMQAIASMPYIIANAIAEKEGTQEKLEALRDSHVPAWDKHGALIITDEKERGGRPIYSYINASYSNPYQPIIEVFAPTLTAIAAGESKETIINDGLMQSAKKFVSPYTDPALALEAAKSLVNLSFGDPQDPTKEFAKFYKTLEPGFVKFGRDAAQKLGAFKSPDAILGTSLTPADLEAAFYPQSKGKKFAPPQTFNDLGKIINRQGLNLGGMSERTVDVHQASAYTAQKIAKNYNANSSQLKYRLRSMFTEPTTLVEPDSDRMNVALAQAEDILQQEFLFHHKFRKLYDDMVTLKGSRQAALKALLADPTVRSSFPAKQIIAMTASEDPKYFPSGIVSKNFLKSFAIDIANQPALTREELSKNFRYFNKKIIDLESEYRGKSLLDDPTDLE